MRVNRNNLNTCYNCGALNVTGVKVCGNCYAVQYYNCPYCQAWVDNAFARCPNCGKKLNWPKESYGPEYAFSQNRSTSTAVVVLLLTVAVLSIVAFNLITNHTNTDAGTNTPEVALSSGRPAGEMKVAAQPAVQESVTEPPATPQSEPAVSNTGTDTSLDNTGTSGAYLVPDTPQYPPVNATSTGTYTPKPASSYLKMMYPNWGRCSGGSCSGYYQYGQ
jgi:hypothetical protein